MSEEDYKSGYRDGIVAGEVDRAAIIEECARLADSYAAPNYSGSTPEHIARAIRARKDKPYMASYSLFIRVRNDAFEECALMIEEYSASPNLPAYKAAVAESLAARIRALKDKP